MHVCIESYRVLGLVKIFFIYLKQNHLQRCNHPYSVIISVVSPIVDMAIPQQEGIYLIDTAVQQSLCLLLECMNEEMFVYRSDVLQKCEGYDGA